MSLTFTIICAVYNGERQLPNFFNSIRSQEYKNFELIIIDGASSDNSIEIIKQHEKHISYWVSEKDAGIYDAWNKGIAKASGDYIIFLGCDDVLLPGALTAYADFINKLDEPDQIDFISSRVQMIDVNGNAIRVKGWPFQWPLFLKEMTVAHPGALHSRGLFEKYGAFNIEYKIVGDYELLLRGGENLKAAYMDEITVLMSEGGASDSTAAIREHFTAVTTTGKYSAIKAGINALVVYLKFVIKKMARGYGFNLYLKKA